MFLNCQEFFSYLILGWIEFSGHSVQKRLYLVWFDSLHCWASSSGTASVPVSHAEFPVLFPSAPGFSGSAALRRPPARSCRLRQVVGWGCTWQVEGAPLLPTAEPEQQQTSQISEIRKKTNSIGNGTLRICCLLPPCFSASRCWLCCAFSFSVPFLPSPCKGSPRNQAWEHTNSDSRPLGTALTPFSSLLVFF